MGQREGAARLCAMFYEEHRSKANPLGHVLKIRHHGGGYLMVPTVAHQASMNHRRAEILPDSFRFTWPNLPGPGDLTSGAHYL